MIDRSHSFETGASLYAWDIHDEGIEVVLDNLRQMAAVNSVYLIGLMHPERHPWPAEIDYPHNPVRKSYFPEDSRVYWHPRMDHFGRIRPALSDHEFLRSVDWLERLSSAGARRGMRTGLEVSHTIVGAERALAEFPDCVQRNIHGEPLDGLHVGGARPLCFNNPDVSEYIVNLFVDVVTNYDVDYVQSCIIPYPMPVPFLLHEFGEAVQPNRKLAGFGNAKPYQWPRLVPELAGCFCDSCRAQAIDGGIDFDRVRQVLLDMIETDRRILGSPERKPHLDETDTSETAFLIETPELFEWLRFRCDSVTRMYATLHSAVHDANPSVDLRLNQYVTTHPEYAGLDLGRLKAHLDSVRACDYSERLGNVAYLDQKRRFLNSLQRILHDQRPLHSAISVSPGAAPDIIEQGIRVANDCGVAGVSIGHYDTATFDQLRAVGHALRHKGLGE